MKNVVRFHNNNNCSLLCFGWSADNNFVFKKNWRIVLVDSFISTSFQVVVPGPEFEKTVRFCKRKKNEKQYTIHIYLSVTAGGVRTLQRVLRKYTYLLCPPRQLINFVTGKQRGVSCDRWKEGKYCSMLLRSRKKYIFRHKRANISSRHTVSETLLLPFSLCCSIVPSSSSRKIWSAERKM